MKLIDLLSVIPDECEIGLVRFDDGFSISYGDKSEAMQSVAHKYRLIKEQVENMDVRHVYPAAYAQCNSIQLFGIYVPPPLYVKPEIIIEIE